jgi:plastocyanin
MRFYAPTLDVAAGDKIEFHLDSFHTTTLLPANVDEASWVEDHAGGFTKDYSFVTVDPDDTAIDPGASGAKPSLKANNQALFPSNPLCGTSGSPCDYTGTAVVNSGAPQGPGPATFTATIDAAPGDTVWVICLVHPHMRLRINVVASQGSETSQAAIDAYRTQKMKADAEQANALNQKLNSMQTKHRLPSGKVVWDAYAGYDTHSLSLDGMYPKKLVIRKGQTVRWHYPDVYEDHTVTMPKSKALKLENEFFSLVCDPDGDAGPGPDTQSPPGPPCGGDFSKIELDLPSRDSFGHGDGVYKAGTDWENSGVRGASISPTQTPYDLKFAKASTTKGFKYMCLIHGGFMSGKVVVH